MLGNWATGSLRIVRPPTSTSTIEITIATIGRLMKNFDIGSPSRCVCAERLWIDPHPRPDLLSSFHHDCVPGMEPIRDHPAVVNLHSDGNWLNDHLVVVVHYCDLVTALQL